MENNAGNENPTRRTEPRTLVDLYYSVEFSLEGLDSIYQFIIYDISQRGICILIKENSAVLDKLKVGDVFDMKYYPIKLLGPTEHLKTEIKHITRENSGRYKDHYLVGLSVKEKIFPEQIADTFIRSGAQP
ncbi:MAG: PilZ domain-containing protein [Proteobacteria bacterium]|nr:PilZ domain-containing protein [Pseudomonadota bacterium]